MQTPPRVFRKASATEAIYIQTHTVVVSKSSVTGRITREQFDTAIALLETRFSILRAIVIDDTFVERPTPREPVVEWVSPDTTSAEDMYAELLNADIDVTDALYSVYVIAGDEAHDVFLLTSHAITDATSLIELHAYLTYLCDCVVQGVDPMVVEQPFPEHIDAAVDHCLSLLGPNAAVADGPRYDGRFAQLPIHVPDPLEAPRHRLERLVVEPDDMHLVREASHRHGVSVHSLLLAAFALAIRDLSEEQASQILMRSSIDMRRRLEPHVSVELVFSAITGHVTHIVDMDQPIHEIARVVFEDIHNGVTDGRIFYDYKNYPRAFGHPGEVPVALNISDMGAVSFHKVTERMHPTGFEYALGWLKKFPNTSVSIYDGKLVANTVYVEDFVPPAVMGRMSELVLGHLRGAYRNDPASATG